MFEEFLHNLLHNLFKPMLLFFYAGFLIPLLGVKFSFPKAIYQGLTIYLLLAIGWHGGEELATLSAGDLAEAAGFMVLGFFTNLSIGLLAFWLLRKTTRLRQLDAATVAGYYGSDSAGTFVTALGVLAAANVAFAAYMPVLLAVMELPGCLVALYLVSRLRSRGMDAQGNLPGEPGHGTAQGAACSRSEMDKPADECDEDEHDGHGHGHGGHGPARTGRIQDGRARADAPRRLSAAACRVLEEADHHVRELERAAEPRRRATAASLSNGTATESAWSPDAEAATTVLEPPMVAIRLQRQQAEQEEAVLALESVDEPAAAIQAKSSFLTPQMLHEVFLNPGIFLLMAGVAIGFASRLQGEKVTAAGDLLYVNLFQGVLCLFLLEMGITAASKLKDLRAAGGAFVAFGLLAPNLFALVGLSVAHGYSLVLGHPFEIGTYVLFAVLCAAASYIALPAVQRMAIPEASPTLPLAAALGLTFTYNVTIGIPVYMLAAKVLTTTWPVVG